jgi:hypothetical protein
VAGGRLAQASRAIAASAARPVTRIARGGKAFLSNGDPLAISDLELTVQYGHVTVNPKRLGP